MAAGAVSPGEGDQDGPLTPPLEVVPGRMPAREATLTGIAAQVGAAAPTGVATVSIPIGTSPARGFAPDLTLAYSSHAGDGVFGEGFTLDLPVVERRTNRRIPRYDGTDAFQFDGMALSRLADEDLREIDGVRYAVTPYGCRVTDSVRRIEHWSAPGDAGFWRIIDGAGLITVYGVSAPARIADPADASRVFAWLPQATYDASGCAITFGYKQEDATGLPDVCYETNRDHRANRYPQTISYGNELPFQARSPAELPVGPWHFEVVFDYGEYDFDPGNDTPHRPVRPWGARQLPFSDYTAGFERRTHRLCRAIAQFHRFPELGQDPVLVRTVSFRYDLAGNPGLATHLTEAQTHGYRYAGTRPSGDRYWRVADAPVTFGYQLPDFGAAGFAPLLTAVAGVPPAADQADSYQVADLDGSGVAGIVYADSRGLLYWQPTLDSGAPDGPVRFSPQLPVPFPVERPAAGRFRLEDVTGDGRLSLVADETSRAGYYGRGPAGQWHPFRPFNKHVTDSAASSQAGGYARADLTGNGFPDLVRLTQAAVSYAPNLGRAGFGTFDRATRPASMPAAVTSAPRAATRFASVLGSGEQLVLVRSGRLTCWPSLGYGRFGPPVELGGVPRFDDVADKHVLLADLTGTGAADLVLVRPGQVDIYLNQAGNAFSREPLTIDLPVPAPASVSVGSVTTDGRPSLVLSTGGPRPRLHALTLGAGQHPFRLTEVDNGLGLRTRLSYSTSSRMQLQDAAAGLPWQLSLPIPVAVLETVEADDAVAEVRTTTSYRYRDGYFDPQQRQFTGFARVDEREEQTTLSEGRAGVDQAAGVAPSLTRTWFHLGCYPALDLTGEYFAKDPDSYSMPGPTFDWGSITPDGSLLGQAHLALAGTPYRTEAYDADHPGVPYRVDQTGHTIRLLASPPDADAGAAFLIFDRESIAFEYERESDDPAVKHSFTLEVDQFGAVKRECEVSYRRRPARFVIPGQDGTVVTAAVTGYQPARDEPDLLLYGYPARSESFAVAGIEPPAGGRYYHADQIAQQLARALRSEGTATATLVAAHRFFYLGAEDGQAPPERMSAPPRLVRQDVAAFTAEQITALLAEVPLPVPVDQFLAEGGYDYEAAAGLWWQTGGLVSYDPRLFWQPRVLADPVAALHPDRGSRQELRYDPASVAVVETVLAATAGDLLDQRETVEVFDYQTLKPQRSRDRNGVCTEVLYDPLGRVFVSSFRGQVWIDGASSEVGFAPVPIEDPVSWRQPRDLAELSADPAAFLGRAATFVFYDRLGWQRNGTPSATATVSASSYPQDPLGLTLDQPRLAVSYFDGSDRLVQTSVLAQPDTGDPLASWAVTDRLRYNGLDFPLQSYLPFFASSPGYIPVAELARDATGPVSSYDAVGRLVRTDFPAGDLPRAFYATITYRSWSVTRADADDTVKSSPYYKYYVEDGHPLPPSKLQALLAAAEHSDTPATWHFGTTGQPVAQERLLAKDQLLTSVYRYDDAGRQLCAADPRQAAAGRVNLAYSYGLTARPLMTVSADAGTLISLDDVTGAPLLRVNGRGSMLIFARDALHRPAAVLAQDGDAGRSTAPVIIQRNYYGDTMDGAGATIAPNPAQRGQIGRLCVRYDQAGRHEVSAHALTGEPLAVTEQFTADATREPDWQVDGTPAWAELFATLAGQLERDSAREATWFGPLGDPLRSADPGGNVRTWRHNLAGAVSDVDLALGGTAAGPYATGLGYTASGSRSRVGYSDAEGNQIISREFRYDPATRELTGMRSTRVADGQPLQDLSLTYDPVGNLTFATDPAAPEHAAVSADLGYAYDALYRLTSSAGRSVSTFRPQDAASGQFSGVYAAQPAGPKLARYSAAFHYDHADNRVSQSFTVGRDSWTTHLTPALDSNRATEGTVYDPDAFDTSGNAIRLPTISELTWDWDDQLRSVRYGPGGENTTEYYHYEAGGQRRRRVTVHPDGSRTDIRYFPAIDLVRQLNPAGSVVTEYQRVKMACGDQSLGEVLRWVHGDPPPGLRSPQRRFCLDNLVGSAMLELADDASLISYEEYSPFGATVFATGPALDIVAHKAYRYTGEERDQTSGLMYSGARYYAPWLGRWISPDPAGPVDGLNLYEYVSSNPTIYADPTGLGKLEKQIQKIFGAGVVKLIGKSKLLTGALGKIEKGGYNIVEHEKGGSISREKKQIRLSKKISSDLRAVRRVSHEAGHAMYDRPPEIAQRPGMSEREFVRKNALRHYIDEAHAKVFAFKVRHELRGLGLGDIGFGGKHEKKYAKIDARMRNGTLSHRGGIIRIAALVRGEKGSVSGMTYEDKHTGNYKSKYKPESEIK